MKNLTLKLSAQHAENKLPDDLPDYERKDCERIIEICKENGYEIDLLTAYNAWEEHNFEYCASWLSVNNPNLVMIGILNWCDVVETN